MLWYYPLSCATQRHFFLFCWFFEVFYRFNQYNIMNFKIFSSNYTESSLYNKTPPTLVAHCVFTHHLPWSRCMWIKTIFAFIVLLNIPHHLQPFLLVYYLDTHCKSKCIASPRKLSNLRLQRHSCLFWVSVNLASSETTITQQEYEKRLRSEVIRTATNAYFFNN